MHEAVLMYADVDECAKVGDVGDDAFENHAGAQVLHVLDTVLESGGFEFRSWVAAGFFQFFEHIVHGGQTKAFIGVFFRTQ